MAVRISELTDRMRCPARSRSSIGSNTDEILRTYGYEHARSTSSSMTDADMTRRHSRRRVRQAVSRNSYAQRR